MPFKTIKKKAATKTPKKKDKFQLTKVAPKKKVAEKAAPKKPVIKKVAKVAPKKKAAKKTRNA